MFRAANRRRMLTALIVVVAVAAGLAWYAKRQSGISSLPQLELVLIDEQRLPLSQWADKPIVVNFWATSCKTCIEEMPELIQLYEKYRPRGLRVLGIAMPYDRPDYVTEMKRQRPIPYTVALDPKGRAIRAFGNVSLTPTTFVFDRRGKLVYHRVGRIDFEALEQVIEQSLKNNPGAGR